MMNTALVKVAERIADNLKKFAVTELVNTETGDIITDMAAITNHLGTVHGSHNKVSLELIERLHNAVRLHTDGIYSDDDLANAIVESHLDIINETIVFTQEVEYSK